MKIVSVTSVMVAVSIVSLQATAAVTKKETKPPRPKAEQQFDMEAELDAAKKQLAQLLKKFTDSHPRVKDQRHRIRLLEGQLAVRRK